MSTTFQSQNAAGVFLEKFQSYFNGISLYFSW